MSTTRLPGMLPVTVAFGALLGFSLSRIGFSSYDELHKMLVFADLRMFLAFGGGLVLSALAFNLLMRGRFKVHRPIHKGTIPGSIVFGLGWALAGGCPSIPFVQLGEGKLAAVFTITGIAVGMVVFGWLQRRWLRWDTGSRSV